MLYVSSTVIYRINGIFRHKINNKNQLSIISVSETTVPVCSRSPGSWPTIRRAACPGIGCGGLKNDLQYTKITFVPCL